MEDSVPSIFQAKSNSKLLITLKIVIPCCLSKVRSLNFWAVVVAQLAEWLLPTPEDPGSNLAIGNFYETYLLLTVCTKDENKIKRDRE